MDNTLWLGLGGLGVSLVTVLLGKGIDALIKLNRSRHDQQVEDRSIEDKNLLLVVGRNDQRIAHLEARLEKLHEEHKDCLRTQERFRGQIDSQQQQIEHQQKLIERLQTLVEGCDGS